MEASTADAGGASASSAAASSSSGPSTSASAAADAGATHYLAKRVLRGSAVLHVAEGCFRSPDSADVVLAKVCFAPSYFPRDCRNVCRENFETGSVSFYDLVCGLLCDRLLVERGRSMSQVVGMVFGKRVFGAPDHPVGHDSAGH